MPTITLLEKTYGPFPAETFEPTFSSLCKGLKIKLKITGKTNRGWIQTKISGEDETAALHYLNQEIGLAPTSIKKLKKYSTLQGRIIPSRENKNQLHVDIGIFSPQICDAVIPLKNLHTQLTNGKKLPLQQITNLFCLHENLPLKIKVTSNVNARKKHVQAELSETQLSQIKHWIHSNLDRLIILGAPFSNVEHAVNTSKHARDIIKVESLGLLEHMIVCKLGTHAIGLMPKFGHFLPHAILTPFCPRKIQEFVNGPGRT